LEVWGWLSVWTVACRNMKACKSATMWALGNFTIQSDEKGLGLSGNIKYFMWVGFTHIGAFFKYKLTLLSSPARFYCQENLQNGQNPLFDSYSKISWSCWRVVTVHLIFFLQYFLFMEKSKKIFTDLLFVVLFQFVIFRENLSFVKPRILCLFR